MSASSLSQSSDYSANSLHPALSGGDRTSALASGVLVCPLPHSVLSHEQLLSELSHELKTPLTGIMGLAQVIQRQTNPIAGRERQYADLIYQKSQQLLIAINDLFDFTQLSIRQFVLQLRPLDLAPIFKTAYQTAQRTIGLMPHLSPQFVQDIAAAEHWMVADQARLEQLLTHLISYLLLLSPVERQLQLAVGTQNNWMMVTLTVTPARCANPSQENFAGSNPFSALNTAVVPGESSAVLKFLLARQLAQLHGGEISWFLTQPSGLATTVFLPRDLTRTTSFWRSPQPNDPVYPFCLILSLDTDIICGLTQVLRAQNLGSAVARSLMDAQDKLRNLEPSLIMVDCKMGQVCSWAVLSHWVMEQSTWADIDLIWIGTVPPGGLNPQPFEIWPSVPTPETMRQALHRWQTRFDPPAVPLWSPQPESKATQPAKPLMLLQLGDVSPTRSADPLILQLITQLSQIYGCSILAVDDLEQAELLARIWQPKVMFCSGMPSWVANLVKSDWLRHLPLIGLEISGQNTRFNSQSIDYIPFAIASDSSSQQIEGLTHQLYRMLCQAASNGLDAA